MARMPQSGFVLVPAPGQRGVPRLLKRETPPSDTEPTLYDQARGYPISVSTRSGMRSVKDVRIELHAVDRPQALVAGFLFSPRHPYSSRFPGNKSSVHFVATRPLRSKTTYCVRFTTRRNEIPLEVVWTFTTR